jgi:hypothetical protein
MQIILVEMCNVQGSGEKGVFKKNGEREGRERERKSLGKAGPVSNPLEVAFKYPLESSLVSLHVTVLKYLSSELLNSCIV